MVVMAGLLRFHTTRLVINLTDLTVFAALDAGSGCVWEGVQCRAVEKNIHSRNLPGKRKMHPAYMRGRA
jgi:hypothetical protein